jgi:KRAB domain-containing zinc finger protein
VGMSYHVKNGEIEHPRLTSTPVITSVIPQDVDGAALHAVHVSPATGNVPNTQPKCTFCSYVTSDKSNMRRHVRRHNHDEYYKCDRCESKFAGKYDLAVHARMKHDGMQLMCQYCSKTFTSRQGLSAHQKMAHDEGEKKYKCTICSASFVNKSHYVGHVNKHQRSKPYTCTICNDSFSYSSNLRRHTKSCQGNARVPCKTCGKGYACAQGLKEHISAKHSDSVHSCPCGRVYNWKKCLSRHRKLCPIAQARH